MQPVFSIITVTYNAASCLERTIRSILQQTYPGIEYLIIDGNSTDGTLELIRNYESGISYWVSEPDKGLYDAMNKGLAKATGDYVWFMNAGDSIYSPDTVQKIVDSIPQRAEWPGVIYGETAIVDADNRFIGMRRLKAPQQLGWKDFRNGMLVCHQSFIPRREIAPLYNTKYKLVADYDWCIKCLKKSACNHNTHLILSNFADEGLSSINRKQSLKERYRIMCTWYGTLPTGLRHVWFAIRFYFAKWIKGRV
ncbi:MAG: glycosyltransferase [Tannerellaceae bacterium]|nr:glycosyltransferase [Tannerellaceae bacterium]